MMPRLQLLCVCFLILTYCLPAVSGQTVTNGISLGDTIKTMRDAGYIETELAMMPPSGEAMRCWVVDQGVLITQYSLASKSVVALTFWISDERPRATAKTFAFHVQSFDPGTGAMIIRTRKGEPGGAPNGSQPARLETDRTSSSAGSRR